MTNAEFKELSPEEVAAFFSQATAEELEGLTKDQKAAYETYLLSKVEEPVAVEEPTTPAEKAAEFFAQDEAYEEDFVYVTSDLVVFHGNLKGSNLLANYLDSKKSEGITASKYSK
jgi:hypothetical protein